MFIRYLFLSSIIIQLSGCIATPRFVSNRVSDYEPPSAEQREQREKEQKAKEEQLKQQEGQQQKTIVAKPPKSEDSI